MYTLTLKVNNNRLYLVPEESDTIPKYTDEPIVAYFEFSSEWKDAAIVIGFYNADGECPPQVLMEDSYCNVPPEAVSGRWFRLVAIGKKKSNLLKTNTITILQNGG